VIDRTGAAEMGAGDDGLAQRPHVDDKRLGRERARPFVRLVVEDKIGVVLRQPPLVRVLPTGSVLVGEFHDGVRSCFLRNIDDRNRIFVGGKTYFPATICRVGSLVPDTLHIVGVSVAAVTVCKGRDTRISEMHEVESAAARGGSHGIRVAGLFVHKNIVGVPEPRIMGRFRESRLRAFVEQPLQIKDLHPVPLDFGDD